VGSHSTQVSNSSRKLHSIHIIVLVHNVIMYMAHTTLRLGFNFSNFPPRSMKIEVWPIFYFKISTADLQNTILDDRSSVLEMSFKSTSKYVRRCDKRCLFTS